MNVSETNKVKLTNKREIPQEVVFKTDVSTRDSNKPNRYIFEFPPQWTKQLDKDAIIGIRSIFLMKKQRFIRFNYEVSLKRKNENNICFKRIGYIRCYIDQNEDIEKLALTWKRYWFDNSEIVYGADLGIDINKEDIKFNFYYSNNACMINIGLAHYLENDYLLINDEEYIPIISITEEGSNDLENLFGKSTFSGSPRIQIPCWTRRSCMITSSIAYEAHDNYLGFSRDYAYDPIKYYRITSDHKRFWIDLWESRDNSIPVVLPKGDQIFIEAIVLFDANSIL